MSKPTFKDIAWTLSDFFNDTDALLRATERVESLVNNTYRDTQDIVSPDGKARYAGLGRWDYPQYELVRKVRHTPAIMDLIQQGKKIQAIKELRDNTSCSLKAAKDAVDAVWTRVWNPTEMNPPHYDPELADHMSNYQEDDN